MSAKKHGLADEFEYMKDLSMNFPQITQVKNPNESIQKLLEWLGKVCVSERSYIFEIYEDDTFSNTYEWCDTGVSSQMQMLQKESLRQISWWLEMFQQNKPVIIEDIEEIKTRYPAAYAILKPQDITSLISVGLYTDGKIFGFLGIDNSDFKKANQIVPLLFMIANLFSYMLNNRDLVDRLSYCDYHDQLTSSLNRNAFKKDLKKAYKWFSLGLVHCNVLELKTTDSLNGFETNDEIIKKWSDILSQAFHHYNIYRVSEDEFIIVCPNVEKWQFNETVMYLNDLKHKNKSAMVYGFAWDNKLPIDVSGLLSEAENMLHEYKERYDKRPVPDYGEEKVLNVPVKVDYGELLKDANGHILYHFIEENYFNLETFFKSMSMADHHPYFGDLVTKQWYVSDSMKDLMGLNDNVVTDLLSKWEEYIPYPEDLELFRNDIAGVMSMKKSVHDLVYRIQDKNYNEYWIRCFGLIRWNEDKTKPLFFCGNVSKLNYAFVVDSITNFPKEKSAIREISRLQQLNKKVSFVCFRLNEFSEINELRGRSVANSLLKDIANNLNREFGKKIQFYRLDGLRFLSVIPKEFFTTPEEVARKIRNIITDMFTEYNLPVRIPCVIGILDDHSESMTAQEIITDVMSLLEIAKKNSETQLVYSTNTVKTHREQKQMIMELRKDSMDYNNFRSVIQPIVDAGTHKIVGGELLLRWKYNGNDVSPGFFIPALENNNLINHVGRGVFEQAVRHCKRINTTIPDFFLDFNISYNQIYDKSLLPFMSEVIQKWGVNAKNLVLELTETHYNNSPVRLQEFIEECKGLGMRMALDDFGVGYSSLEMLVKYPANVVKLDRSLMKKMSDSKEITDFITAIVYACHKFGKLVCVEGVETEQELKIVTEAGCDMVQGYYFYRPMEVFDVYDLLTSQNDKT